MTQAGGIKIVMIGDSIIDAGRRLDSPPYGTGYMSLVREQFTERHPELDINWENRGVGGDTVRHLAARWQEDVIDEQPDVLTVMIGINDVWRRFGDHPLEAVPADEYVSTLVSLLRRVKAETAATIIVGSPYVIEPDRSEPMRHAMDIYGGLARQVADEIGAPFIDVQSAFDRELEHSDSADWADDRVHPNRAGHQVIADVFLTALEATVGDGTTARSATGA